MDKTRDTCNKCKRRRIECEDTSKQKSRLDGVRKEFNDRTSLADMLDEDPSEDLVKAVENRILLAQEQEESIDLSKIVESIQTMQSSWV